MALHFRRPLRSRTRVPCSTSNSDSASISRCLSDSNLSQCQIKRPIVSQSCRHTHIGSSTIPNPMCDRTELCLDIMLDTEVTKLLPSFWPSNHGRSDTLGRMEWANRPWSAESHFLCQFLNKTGLAKLWKSQGNSGLSKMEPFNDASCFSIHQLVTHQPYRNHISFTSMKSLIRSNHNCVHFYTSGWVRHEIRMDSIALIESSIFLGVV
jgi:hypothetical protein